MPTKAFQLGRDKVTLEAVREVAEFGRKVVLTPAAKKKIDRAYRYLQGRTTAGETIYGVNTGFGLLSAVRIPEADLEELQYNLLRSHSVGTGSPITIPQSRAMLFLRAVNLSIGHSGVRVGLVEQCLKLLNADVTPWIPEQGSVGASGDLAPLSHLSQVLDRANNQRFSKNAHSRLLLQSLCPKPVLYCPCRPRGPR